FVQRKQRIRSRRHALVHFKTFVTRTSGHRGDEVVQQSFRPLMCREDVGYAIANEMQIRVDLAENRGRKQTSCLRPKGIINRRAMRYYRTFNSGNDHIGKLSVIKNFQTWGKDGGYLPTVVKPTCGLL